VLPVAAATNSSSLGGASDPVLIKSEFPQGLGQQMGAASQGIFPMMNPNMWNVPMNQWQQFFGNQQFPPPGFNPMMMMPPGITPTHYKKSAIS
jgi:hypothetical protein